METKNFKHNDCSNFAPIDVAKGICRITNKTVFTDTPVCPTFSELAKCKNCTHFVDSKKENMGVCTGLEKENWTYANLVAKTCEGYDKK